MHKRISAALVVGLTSTLLTGCGGGSAETAAPTTVAPAAPTSVAAPSTTAGSPSPTTTTTTTTADDRKLVAAASATFVDAALTLNYADGPDAAYRSRVKPLMTAQGYEQLSSTVPTEENVKAARAQFGKDARSEPQLLGKAVVTSLEGERATATQKFKPRVQQRKDGAWKTVKAAVVDENAKLTLVKEDGRWLVDSLA